jgi:hypothetical protein
VRVHAVGSPSTPAGVAGVCIGGGFQPSNCVDKLTASHGNCSRLMAFNCRRSETSVGRSPALYLTLPFGQRPIPGEARGTRRADKVEPLLRIRAERNFMSQQYLRPFRFFSPRKDSSIDAIRAPTRPSGIGINLVTTSSSLLSSPLKSRRLRCADLEPAHRTAIPLPFLSLRGACQQQSPPFSAEVWQICHRQNWPLV